MRMPWEPVPAEPEPEAPPQEVRINTLCLHTINCQMHLDVLLT